MPLSALAVKRTHFYVPTRFASIASTLASYVGVVVKHPALFGLRKERSSGRHDRIGRLRCCGALAKVTIAFFQFIRFAINEELLRH